MGRLASLIVLLVGLTACQAELGFGDASRHPASVATNATESAAAQAAIGVAWLPNQ